MPEDDSPPSPVTQPQVAATSTPRTPAVFSKSTGFAPPGHAMRRSKTIDDGPTIRRKSLASRSDASFDGLPQGLPRRSSNFSEYNLDEARNILNPRAQPGHGLPTPESSSLASLSLAFALFPAIAGIFFKNGHSLVTDIMLLGLSGVFLHWSVTQPWVWYHAAQQVRIQQEADNEIAVEEEFDDDDFVPDVQKATDLHDVPEETDEVLKPNGKTSPQGNASSTTATPQERAALRELYIHEVLALMSCFLMPVLSAYLLHHIRVQLSRPSEGLVSNYNLTIFLLASELRAFSHTLKLVQSRTLHLQKVVHGNPFASPTQTGSHLEDMLERLERLEARSLADEFVREHSQDISSAGAEDKNTVTRDVRNAIQPELDALNRAVRRYEKKATILQHQTDARFSTLDSRLDDAIALAAVAAKNSNSKNILIRAVESLIAITLFPFNALVQVFMLPLRSLLGLFNFTKKRPMTAKQSRVTRTGKQSAQPRYSGDRVPARVMKR
ncbi:hypothetical protein QQS21_004946 [Conoideocrella luteorostrata]|uniref:Uncharacterized protein n=1 Tax=Conoideocrella luteorostrata TaxID=1105319 RepID=A0AAJ0CSU1_9HYPO|nr:hypothetical protein QQS21_004946 [Conoideocrella luteorostrata]